MSWLSPRDPEVDEEIRSHIRMAIEDRVRAGEDPARARAAVLREFGSVAHVLEDTRRVWTAQWPRDLALDLRFGLRTLARAPGFALAAILSLAIGIGATTALFSVLQHVAWNPLPYRDPARLAILWNLDPRVPGLQSPLSYPDLQDLRAPAAPYADLAAFRNRPGFLLAGEESVQLEFHEVSPEFLPLLGVAPALGRFWDAGESSAVPPAIVSDHLWRHAFGAAPDIVGRRIVVSQSTYRVAAVMSAGFTTPSIAAQAVIHLSPADAIWTPLVLRPAQLANRGNRGLRVLARLHPNVALPAARRALDAAATQLAAAWPDSNRNIGVQLMPLSETITGAVRPSLLALLAAAGLFLFIACANVAGLLLARGSARSHEFATRAALGAGRARLVRQLLAESLLLSVLGGSGGAALAAFFLALARRAAPMLEIPRLAESVLDAPALALALLLALATGFAFGLAPAFRIARLAGNRATTDRRGVRLRQSLIAAVTAVTLVLVFSASTLLAGLRGVLAGQSRDAERTFTFQTTINGTRWNHPPLDRQFYDALLSRLRRLGGVESAAVTTSYLQIGDNSGTLAILSGGPPVDPSAQPMVGYTMADAAYFPLAGLALRAGRLFDAHDDEHAPAVAIVNEAFVRAVIPEGPALGRQVRLLGVAQEPLRIVGVVSDARALRLGAAERPRAFYPYTQSASTRLIAIVRTAPGAPPPVNPVRAILRDLDPTLPLFESESAAGLIARATSAPRWGSALVGAFAAMALLLAAVGVMGVVAFVVSQRARECGIRLALGSTPAALQWLIARQGLCPVAAGLLLGSLAIAASGSATPLLAPAALLIALAAALATYIPARRLGYALACPSQFLRS